MGGVGDARRLLDAAYDHLDAGGNWTAAGSRQAMAIVAAFGVGVMVGASLGTMGLAALV
ncbi:hypothetical protein ACFQH6_02315 [Halobacteriaceae archaeon GCM10025711]